MIRYGVDHRVDAPAMAATGKCVKKHLTDDFVVLRLPNQML